MSRKIVILGAGESGVGSAVLAKLKGFDVFVSDAGSIKEQYKQMLNSHQISWEEKQHSEDEILAAYEVIKSPGIPEKAPIIKAIHKAGIPVISEIEFAGRYTNAKTICITGSNGKTTTTSLIYHILKTAGYNVGLGGNIGKSFAYQVATENYDYYVLELSSFQLDGMYEFCADIAVLTNITPDHLDRYDYKIENYVNSKFRIAQNMGPDQVFIYCQDDPLTMAGFEQRGIEARLIPFTLKDKIKNGAYINDNYMMMEFDNFDFSMPLDELSLKGKHNVYNSMAAAASAGAAGIKKDAIRESLSNFKGVEHRLEPVLKVHGIEFINDSKATNVNSTWYALECMTKPVVWIAGGIDKGNDYSELFELVKHKVKALVCLGVDNAKLHQAFSDKVEVVVDAYSMDDAIKSAYFLAKDGDAVLLSPCCASFDLFQNYEDRGNQFKNCVREL